MANDVNLYCDIGPATTDRGGRATVVVTCGNFGPDAATGPVSLKFVTPFYVNVTSLPQVPDGVSTWQYRNPDDDVPSVVKVTFNGIAARTTVDVPVPIVLSEGSPNVPSTGRAIFTTDDGNTENTDSDLTRNTREFLIVRSQLTTFEPGTCSLHFVHDSQPLEVDGAAVGVPFHFYNGAGKGTRDTAHFTFFTPFYTEIPQEGRPAGLTALYTNPDPAIPSVFQLAVPAGLGDQGPETPTTVQIPFRAQPGAPLRRLRASGIIVPTGRDTQGDRSTNHHPFGLQSAVYAAK